jgi:hypothetical protein
MLLPWLILIPFIGGFLCWQTERFGAIKGININQGNNMVIFIPYLSPVQAILLVITNSDINPLYRRLPVLADRTLWRESAALDRADYHGTDAGAWPLISTKAITW